MKARLIDAAAFVIGALAAFMLSDTTDFPWPIRLALTILSPGYAAGLPLAALMGAIGLASFGFFFLVCILANGLLFGLASYLIRKTMSGQRLARIALTIGMGVWITWGAVFAISAWPRPEHLAQVNVSSPLAGRWNGVLHSPRGDLPVVLVCHPRADSTLDGYLYVRAYDMGQFENGVYDRNSLHFEIIGFEYNAHFDNGKMIMVTTIAGKSDETELQFASADTSRPALAPIDLASPLAGRWDGVLSVSRGERPAVLICHPRTDQSLDGYLYISGRDMGLMERGVWAADSLHFEIERFHYSAHFDSATMAVKRSGNTLNQTMALRFVGADTTRPVLQPSVVQ